MIIHSFLKTDSNMKRSKIKKWRFKSCLLKHSISALSKWFFARTIIYCSCCLKKRALYAEVWDCPMKVKYSWCKESRDTVSLLLLYFISFLLWVAKVWKTNQSLWFTWNNSSYFHKINNIIYPCPGWSATWSFA